MTRPEMPRWPAHALAVLAAACAVPAVTTPAPAEDPAREAYRAHGQEPGWHLTIAGGTIDYVGDYGETRISVPRPDPRLSFNGFRYVTDRLTVDVTYGRCTDTMSGEAFEHQVMVITPEATVRGCGGERVAEGDS